MNKRMTLGKTIAVVLVCILCCGAVMWMFGGLGDMSVDNAKDKLDRKLNEDNFYKAEDLLLEDSNDGSGIVITANENGTFKVKGETSTDRSYTIANVDLSAGTYTITALEGAKLTGAYVVVEYNGSEYNADFTTSRTITIVEDATVTLKLVIKADTEINATVYPVIVEGDEPGDYFA